MSTQPFRWGILSTAGIANKFAEAIAHIPDAVVTAVASRTQEKADAFADKHGIEARHASYEALAADPNVDAIYIATPHIFHMENTLLCLNGGKHVLCEKPFALNAGEAQRMVDVAREKGLFLMEAMWTRFLPVTAKVRELVAAGRIGKPQMYSGDLGFLPAYDPQSRLYNRELAGGALLDLGIYPVSYAAMIFGTQPDDIHTIGLLGDTGVDEHFSVLMSYEGGQQQAMVAGSFRVQSSLEAWIYGSDANIHLHAPFFCAEQLDVLEAGFQSMEVVETYEFPLGDYNGFEYEALEVMECVRAGKLESDILPLDETVAIMRLLDNIRKPWGLVYPGE